MKRNALNELKQWKNSDSRKPMILKGARQVGKTWLMREFGNQNYEKVAYFNFDENKELGTIFESNKDPFRIIELLSLIIGEKVEPENTLIIFDEIQECPEALNSLKYFNEKANEYNIISAGSLLGTLLATPKSYPVGKVNILNISPLKFDEFLQATDQSLYQYYIDIKKDQVIEKVFHEKLLDVYRNYLIVGGMPECVYSWINNKDPQEVLRIQSELLEVYENDFSKHNNKINANRLLMVFRSITSQLAKENKKFVYGVIKEGARAREFEEAIEWLTSAGMINKAYSVSKMEHPLAAFDQLDAFKLYLFDIGLLKLMAGVNNESILLEADFQFKGAMAENFVLQQIKDQFDNEPRYYSDRNGEIDFVAQNEGEIVPIEVKAKTNKQANTFKRYVNEKKPKHAIRYSEMGYVRNGNITNIPFYLINKSRELM